MYVAHTEVNFFVQLVVVDHYNVAHPRVMLFAMENILPTRGLTLNHGVRNVCSISPLLREGLEMSRDNN